MATSQERDKEHGNFTQELRERFRRVADWWDGLTAQEHPVILDLLAHCAAQTANAIQLPHQRPMDVRLEAAHRLAKAVHLDMVNWLASHGSRLLYAGERTRGAWRRVALDCLGEAAGVMRRPGSLRCQFLERKEAYGTLAFASFKVVASSTVMMAPNATARCPKAEMTICGTNGSFPFSRSWSASANISGETCLL